MKNNTLKAMGIAIGAALSLMYASGMEAQAAEQTTGNSGTGTEQGITNKQGTETKKQTTDEFNQTAQDQGFTQDQISQDGQQTARRIQQMARRIRQPKRHVMRPSRIRLDAVRSLRFRRSLIHRRNLVHLRNPAHLANPVRLSYLVPGEEPILRQKHRERYLVQGEVMLFWEQDVV